MSGQIYADDSAIRGAGAAALRLAGRTQGDAGVLSSNCALPSAAGQADVAAAIGDFMGAWGEEMTELEADCADLSSKAALAADTYVMNDTSVMPGLPGGTAP